MVYVCEKESFVRWYLFVWRVEGGRVFFCKALHKEFCLVSRFPHADVFFFYWKLTGGWAWHIYLWIKFIILSLIYIE